MDLLAMAHIHAISSRANRNHNLMRVFPLRSVVDSVCTGGPVAFQLVSWIGLGAFPGGVAGADSLWPDSDRPKHLRRGPTGMGIPGLRDASLVSALHH